MDFAKVKALLIAVFLGLNLFLGYQWWSLQTAVAVYNQPASDQLANIQRSLAQHGVHLAAIVPTETPTMPMLHVTSDHTSLTSIAAQIWGPHVKVHTKHTASGDLLISNQGHIYRSGAGRLVVSYMPNFATTHATFGQKKVLTSLQKWLSRNGYNFSVYQISSWYTHNENSVGTYMQAYNSYPIFSAVLTVYVEHNHLSGYHQQYLGIVGTVNPRPVSSAVNALLSLVQYMDKARINADNTIQDIRLGYDSGITTKSSWYLAPVWRIGTSLGVFYVNAVTGEVGVGNE